MEFTAQCHGYPIRVNASLMGEDLSVTITGGVSPHIGGVSVAHMVDGRIRLEEISLPGHKDLTVSSLYAKRLTEVLRRTVCVSCGIHYDRATKEQLEDIVACTRKLLEELVAALG